MSHSQRGQAVLRPLPAPTSTPALWFSLGRYLQPTPALALPACPHPPLACSGPARPAPAWSRSRQTAVAPAAAGPSVQGRKEKKGFTIRGHGSREPNPKVRTWDGACLKCTYPPALCARDRIALPLQYAASPGSSGFLIAIRPHRWLRHTIPLPSSLKRWPRRLTRAAAPGRGEGGGDAKKPTSTPALRSTPLTATEAAPSAVARAVKSQAAWAPGCMMRVSGRGVRGMQACSSSHVV